MSKIMRLKRFRSLQSLEWMLPLPSLAILFGAVVVAVLLVSRDVRETDTRARGAELQLWVSRYPEALRESLTGIESALRQKVRDPQLIRSLREKNREQLAGFYDNLRVDSLGIVGRTSLSTGWRMMIASPEQRSRRLYKDEAGHIIAFLSHEPLELRFGFEFWETLNGPRLLSSNDSIAPLPLDQIVFAQFAARAAERRIVTSSWFWFEGKPTAVMVAAVREADTIIGYLAQAITFDAAHATAWAYGSRQAATREDIRLYLTDLQNNWVGFDGTFRPKAGLGLPNSRDIEYSREGNRYRAFVTSVGPWQFVAERPAQGQLPVDFGARTVFLVSALAVASLGAMLLLSRRVVDPLRELNQAVASLADGDFNQRVDLQGPSEIGSLALSFNQMAERVQLLSSDLEHQVNQTWELASHLEAENQRLYQLMSGMPIALYDTDGSELGRNAAFISVAAAAGSEMEMAASRAAAALGSLSASNPDGDPSPTTFELETKLIQRGKTYTLRAAMVEDETIVVRGRRICVTVAQVRHTLPDISTLRTHFGLTDREAEIALLLAEGASNKRIAEKLSIRPSTVRTHTEKLFPKLGVRSRKALGIVLLNADLVRTDDGALSQAGVGSKTGRSGDEADDVPIG